MAHSSKSPAPDPLINRLPSDILVPIFELVIASQVCICRFTGSSSRNHVLAYPDTLVHVCSLWRHIGINSPILWTHIDLLTNRSLPFGEKVMGRAEMHAERAGQLPLEVHLPSFPSQTEPIVEDLSRLLSRSSIAARAQSLNVYFDLEAYRSELMFRPLSRLFQNCSPGRVTRLTMWSNSTRIAHPSEWAMAFLWLSMEDLEGILSAITSLSLHMLYFPWSSAAYHGLVELRLTGFPAYVTIPQSQLTMMLAASPGLRILEFGLHITRDSPEGAPISLIQVESLEVLKLDIYVSSDLSFLLHRLVPGPKPLQLSLPRCYSVAGALILGTNPFFIRSNTTTLRVVEYDFYFAAVLVGLATRLQTLVIDRLGSRLSLNKQDTRHAQVLESLYLLNSVFSLDELITFLTLISTQRLVLWKSTTQGISNDDALQRLRGVCGHIQWLDPSAPDPTKDWPLFAYQI